MRVEPYGSRVGYDFWWDSLYTREDEDGFFTNKEGTEASSEALNSNMPDISAKYTVHTEQEAKDANLSEAEIKGLKKSGIIECMTCAQRKYQDGSDEQVSFKSAAHVSPEASAARVRAHEQEHVANAFDKAKEKGGRVLQASVAIETAVCPECGRNYVSGGLTTTRISYPKGGYGDDAKGKDAASGIMGSRADFEV